MPFKKGDKKAGSKPGASNFTKNKPLRDCINRIIKQSDGEKLRKVAEALFAKAAQGDVSAIKEIGDRLDGKVTRQVAGNLDNNITVKIVKFGE